MTKTMKALYDVAKSMTFWLGDTPGRARLVCNSFEQLLNAIEKELPHHEPSSHDVQTNRDDWPVWQDNPGKQPVYDDVTVEVHFFHGGTCVDYAGTFDWEKGITNNHIQFWRLAKQLQSDTESVRQVSTDQVQNEQTVLQSYGSGYISQALAEQMYEALRVALDHVEHDYEPLHTDPYPAFALASAIDAYKGAIGDNNQ